MHKNFRYLHYFQVYNTKDRKPPSHSSQHFALPPKLTELSLSLSLTLNVNLEQPQYGADLSGMLGSYIRLGSFRVVLERSSDSRKVEGADVPVAFVIPFRCSSPEKKTNNFQLCTKVY